MILALTFADLGWMALGTVLIAWGIHCVFIGYRRRREYRPVQDRINASLAWRNAWNICLQEKLASPDVEAETKELIEIMFDDRVIQVMSEDFPLTLSVVQRMLTPDDWKRYLQSEN